MADQESLQGLQTLMQVQVPSRERNARGDDATSVSGIQGQALTYDVRSYQSLLVFRLQLGWAL